MRCTFIFVVVSIIIAVWLLPRLAAEIELIESIYLYFIFCILEEFQTAQLLFRIEYGYKSVIAKTISTNH